ncbi:MAG: acyl-ACP--UDP-N-acetylglucosamine O-acyltransferase [Verrucomicrobiota bacterium]
MVHSSAVVSKDARLGANVQIGPYAVVEPGAEIGDHCVIEAHAVVKSSVRMGDSNVIGTGAVIGGDPQDVKFDPSVVSYVTLGSRNRIREHCTIHRAAVAGGTTVVGDDCFFMVGAHLGHDSQVGNRVILGNGVMLGGFVKVDDAVFLGGGTLVHQHVRIGRLVMTQGNTSISKNVLPYTMVVLLDQVVGLNVVGMRRAGMDSTTRSEVKKAFKLLYRQGLNMAQAVAESKTMEWSEAVRLFWNFVENSTKRGISTWTGRKGRSAVSEPDEV